MGFYRRLITTAGLILTSNSLRLRFADNEFEDDFVDVDDFDEPMVDNQLLDDPLDSTE